MNCLDLHLKLYYFLSSKFIQCLRLCSFWDPGVVWCVVGRCWLWLALKASQSHPSPVATPQTLLTHSRERHAWTRAATWGRRYTRACGWGCKPSRARARGYLNDAVPKPLALPSKYAFRVIYGSAVFLVNGILNGEHLIIYDTMWDLLSWLHSFYVRPIIST